jgi:hypothetical protein
MDHADLCCRQGVKEGDCAWEEEDGNAAVVFPVLQQMVERIADGGWIAGSSACEEDGADGVSFDVR